MTIINQKSISGITSITTAAAGDNLLTFHTNDGTERFRIDNSGSTKITAGIVTTLTVTGNATVGDTVAITTVGDTTVRDLTVRTVTSSDQVISNRSGTSICFRAQSSGTDKFTVQADGKVKIGSNTLVTPDANADNIVIDTGDVDSGLSILSATTGRIYFGDAADDEAGSIRYVHTDNSMRFETNSAEKLRITSGGDVSIVGDSQKLLIGAGDDLLLYHDGSQSYIAGDDIRITNKAVTETQAKFLANGTVELYHNDSKRFETTSSGVAVAGNVAVTSGNGIDFSADGHGSGSMTSELLDDYEEGTFEPTYTSSDGDFNTVTYQGDTGGRYIKIGNYVWCTGCARINGGTLDTSNRSSSASLRIGNLPFANDSRSNGDNSDSPNAVRTPVWNSGSTAPNFIAMSPSVNSANLFYIGSNGAVATVNNVSTLGSESMVQFTVTYQST